LLSRIPETERVLDLQRTREKLSFLLQESIMADEDYNDVDMGFDPISSFS
jgi:hypothetical protein